MDHENLRCYNQLMCVAEGLAKRVAKWPRGYGNLIDQLRRAMTSAVLNLAEGNGKRSSHAERRRFFEISMGSISEVSACLDLASIFGLISRSDHESFKSRLRVAYVQIRALP